MDLRSRSVPEPPTASEQRGEGWTEIIDLGCLSNPVPVADDLLDDETMPFEIVDIERSNRASPSILRGSSPDRAREREPSPPPRWRQPSIVHFERI